MIFLRRLSLAVAAAAAVVLVGGGVAAAAPAVAPLRGATRPAWPVGVWENVVSRPDSPSENVDLVFGANLRLVVRASDGQTSIGSWVPTGPTTFTFTFVRDLEDGDTTIAKITITHSATLGAGGRTLTSTGTATARDLQGNVLVTLPITSTSTRIA